MGLGLIAGGVAKGIDQYSEMRARDAQAEAVRQRTKLEREAADRDTQARAVTQGVPIPGVTQITGREYDPSADVDARAAAATQHPPHKAGLLGALGKFLDKDAAAIGSGVKPPEAVSTGALPASGSSPAPAAAEDGTVEPVTVTAPRMAPRAATEEDAAKYRWVAARKLGDPAAERAAAKEFFDLRIGATKKALVFADDDELTNMLTDVTGHLVEVGHDKDGRYTVAVNGQPAHTYANKDELLGDAFARLDRSPEAGMAVAMGGREEARKSMLANAQVQTLAAQARNAAAQTAIAARKDNREQTGFEIGLEDRKAGLKALDYLSHPENAILNPEEWSQNATIAARFMPDMAKGYVQTADDQGNPVRTPVNNFEQFGAAHVDSYKTNPYVVSGKIAIAPDQNGVNRFWVKGAKPGEIYPAATLSEAERRARSLYGKPSASKPAIPSAPPKQPLM